MFLEKWLHGRTLDSELIDLGCGLGALCCVLELLIIFAHLSRRLMGSL